MKLQPADIILFGGKGSLLGRAILKVMNWFQKDPVVHFHAFLVKDETEGIEAVLKVQRTNILYKLEHSDKYKIIRNRVLTDKQRENIVKSAEKLVGQKYSISRLLLQLLDQMLFTNFFTKIKKSQMEHVCSSLVAWAYYSRTKIKFNGADWRSCEPDDIDDEVIKNNVEWEVIAEK